MKRVYLRISVLLLGLICSSPAFAVESPIKINFQPDTVPVPTSYHKDVGFSFGPRDNGFTYGWSQNISGWSPKNRNNKKSPDELHDTLLFMIGRSWEMSVANGTYQVRLVAGDPNSSHLQINVQVEGQSFMSGSTTSQNRWLDITSIVEVTDGKLSIADQSGNNHARLCFIEVTLQNGSPNEPPVISSNPLITPAPVIVGETADATVLATDPENMPLTFTWSKVSGPGAVSFNPNGNQVSYQANAIFNAVGDYVIRVEVSDSVNVTTRDLPITVTNAPVVSQPPVAVNDHASTTRDTAVDITVLANDSDPNGDALSVTAISMIPVDGSVVINGNNTITYTPNSGFTGADQFEYTISDGALTASAIVSISVSNTSSGLRAIAPSAHPNLYFNSTEISTMRVKIQNGSAGQEAMNAWNAIKDTTAIGIPSGITYSLTWFQVYTLAQPLGKRNMQATMSYMLQPTDAKASAMKSALLSWTGSNTWSSGAQRGGHMQYPLAWMYDLLYNATFSDGSNVLGSADKAQADAFFQKFAKILTKKPFGVSKPILTHEGVEKVGYDNFYTLDQTAGLVYALVSHDQSLVDKVFISDVPNDDFMNTHPAFAQGDIRSFKNLIQGQVYPSGYTYDGYKRQYGFNTAVGFNGENKGDGQHYHFFALLGYLPAAEAAAHNGFDAWAYTNNRLLQGFIKGASWAHTAFRQADNNGQGSDRNHAPLYWMLSRQYPNDATINGVLARPESKQEYSYFFSNIGPLWSLAQ